MNEFKIGNSYIIKWTGLSTNVIKGKIVDLTKTTVKIRWESGNEIRYELSTFFYNHHVLEDLGNEFFKSMHYCYEKV